MPGYVPCLGSEVFGLLVARRDVEVDGAVLEDFDHGECGSGIGLILGAGWISSLSSCNL